jgi:uncharacterized protein YceK
MKRIDYSEYLLIICMAILMCVMIVGMTGCGAMNTYTGAAINAAESGYAGARQNAKAVDDMKLIAWSDAACAMPLGAIARNATGNPYAVSAVLTACPVPNVGIVQARDGQVQVQFTQPTPTTPYAPPTAPVKP